MIPHIIPQPACVEAKPGVFTLLPNSVITAQDDAVDTARLLAGWLGKPTGYPLPIQPTLPPGKTGIRLEIDLSLGYLGREGYRLEVNPTDVVLRAPTSAGLFYAVQTLRQLFPAQIFSPPPGHRSGSSLADTGSDDRRSATLWLARRDAGRQPALHAGGVCRTLHRPDGAP